MRSLLNILICLTVACCIITSFSLPVYADSPITEMTTVELDDELYDRLVQNLEINLISQQPQKTLIQCFDVNENGEILIGTGIGTVEAIHVYDPDGTFLYGYKVYSLGNVATQWSQNGIVLYYIRESVAVLIDKDGEILKIEEYTSTLENDEYMRKVVYANVKENNGNIFKLQNDISILDSYATHFSKLTVTNALNETIEIYNANSFGQFINILNFARNVIVIMFLIAVPYALHLVVKRKNRKTGDGSLS